MIAVITAMKIESESVISRMSEAKAEKAGHVECTVGKLCGADTVVCVSGVGKVNAAASTQAVAMKYDPDMIINIGVAGAADPRLGIGDFVIGSSCVQFDVDTSPIGDPKYMISGINRISIDAEEATVRRAEETAKKLFPNKTVISGRIASSDKFIGGENAYLKEEAIGLGAACIEMESGSIAQVALLNNIPYIAVRTISDSADGSAPESFGDFCAESAKNAESWLCEFIKNELIHIPNSGHK